MQKSGVKLKTGEMRWALRLTNCREQFLKRHVAFRRCSDSIISVQEYGEGEEDQIQIC